MSISLSDNFTLEEAIASETAERQGINNNPDTFIIGTLSQSAIGMERVRALLGNIPIHINSWYRSEELNRVVGSKDTSQHIKGEAIDFICPFYGDPIIICKKLIEHKELIRYDQLILEHTWIHISFAVNSGNPKGQVLSLLSNGRYSLGLTDKEGKPV